jgi:multimeric flavodoxin WrbA
MRAKQAAPALVLLELRVGVEMKVIGICASPRKGNTEQMVSWVLSACAASGAEIELVNLRDIDMEQCRGCNECYGKGKHCVIDDDIFSLFDRMENTDALVFGTPNYFNNVSGLMKCFIDRNNSVCSPSVLMGKPAALVCVGARGVKELKSVEKLMLEYFRIMGISHAGSVLAQADDPREVSAQKRVKDACTELGKKLVKKMSK